MGNKETRIEVNEVFHLTNCPFNTSEPNFNKRLFECFPKAWDLSKICPELVFYRTNCGQKFFSYSKDERLLIRELLKSGFLSVKRIVFITHGFLSSPETQWLETMKWELLNAGDYTVCTVGWGNGAKVSYESWNTFWNSYEQSASNALEVGKWLSKYLLQIRKLCKHLNIYCVGHSLGAHLMGWAGRQANKEYYSVRPVIDRITGLDPAGPGFQTSANTDQRLCKSDAQLVDVIHTDGWGYGYYFGTYLPLGSVDFYPNWGFHQKSLNPKDRTPEVSPRGDISHSHSRAIDYYIWSISHKNCFKTNRILLDRPDVESITYTTRKSQFSMQMGFYADCYGCDVQKLIDRWFLVTIDSQIPRF